MALAESGIKHCSDSETRALPLTLTVSPESWAAPAPKATPQTRLGETDDPGFGGETG